MDRSPVLAVIEWDVPAAQAGRITSALQTVMLATREQPGCLACSLSADAGRRVTLHYQESWATEADLVEQLQSERFAVLARLIESASSPPRVAFTLPGGTRGLDFAFEARGVTSDRSFNN